MQMKIQSAIEFQIVQTCTFKILFIIIITLKRLKKNEIACSYMKIIILARKHYDKTVTKVNAPYKILDDEISNFEDLFK